MKFKILFAAIIVFGSRSIVFAQININNIAPISTFANDTIVITGSGFSSNAANLEVWFGSVRGTIIASSEFGIEVRVPAEARATNVTVVNKATNTSAVSAMKFIPRLKTESFSVSKFDHAFSSTSANELWDMCVCDLNSDGKPDVATTKFYRGQNTPYLNDTDMLIFQNTSVPGAISFIKKDKNNLAALNLLFQTDHVVCGDLNADGKPELIVSRAGTTRNSIHILKNTSAGSTLSFAPIAPTVNGQNALYLDASDRATRIAVRDLNNDGRPELTVTNQAGETIYIFVNQSSGGTLLFNTTPIKLDIEPANAGTIGTYDIELQDFNNDGWADIIASRFIENNFYIFRNLRSGAISFADPVKHSTEADNVVFNRVNSADFNKDGRLDLIFTNSSLTNGKLSAIYMNQSNGDNIAFTADASATKFSPAEGAWGIDVTDIDGDDDVDFVIAPYRSNELNVYIHNGSTATPAFTKEVIPVTAPALWFPRNVKAGDLDGDGKPDIVFTAQNDGTHLTSLEVLSNTHCHQPEIENVQPITICNGQTIVLKAHQAPTANGATTFEWKKDNVITGTNSPFLTITAPGTYRITNTANGCGLYDEVVVAFDNGGAPTDPLITANTPLCAGATLNLTAAPVAGGIFTWTKPDGTTVTGKDQNITVSLGDAGIYSLQVQVDQCKSDIVTKRVDVASLGSFQISANPASAKVCQGGTIQLAVGNVANHQYDWKKNGVSMGLPGNTTNISVSDEASYSVVITNTTLSCDTETGAVATVVLATPVASYTVPASGCTGTPVDFTNTTSLFDNRGTISYSWNFGQAPGSAEANPTKTYTSAGVFSTSLTASYSDVTGTGCSGSATKQITISNTVQPAIISEKTSLCPDETSILSVAGAFNSIVWSNSATGNSTTVTGPATYSVSTTDENGCTGTDDFVINDSVVPTVTASADPLEIRMGGTSQLQATGTDIEKYQWSPADNLRHPITGSSADPATIANPLAAPLTTTTFVISVKGADPDGAGPSLECTASSEVEIIVSGVEKFPLAFSPNNDGINDIWDIGAPNKAECTLSIFDSRGRKVFEDKGENWNGKYQNNDVPEGTYYYVFGCPNAESETGHVLVMR